MRGVGPGLILLLMDGPGADAAEDAGVTVVREAFIDLDYDEDGGLLIERVKTEREPEDVARRAVRVAKGRIVTTSGKEIETRAHSVCIHGDVPNAVEVAVAVRSALQDAEVEIASMRQIVAESISTKGGADAI